MNCSTLREQTAGYPPSTSQVSLPCLEGRTQLPQGISTNLFVRCAAGSKLLALLRVAQVPILLQVLLLMARLLLQLQACAAEVKQERDGSCLSGKSARVGLSSAGCNLAPCLHIVTFVTSKIER